MGHDGLLVVLNGLGGVPKARAIQDIINCAGLGLILLRIDQLMTLIHVVVSFVSSPASVAHLLLDQVRSLICKATGPC
jgi:hypothetical protein